MNIYIVTHKEISLDNYQLDKCYKIIGVGNYAQNTKENICKDNTGLNISEKNANYCELTALYWIWKNDVSDITGLVHYRRFFTKAIFSNSPLFFLKEKDIKNILNKYDAIVPKRINTVSGAYAQYLKCGYEKDIEHVKEVIKKISPEYIPYFEKYFEYSAGFRPFNMIITRKNTLNSYCDWLFKILECVEKKNRFKWLHFTRKTHLWIYIRAFT